MGIEAESSNLSTLIKKLYKKIMIYNKKKEKFFQKLYYKKNIQKSYVFKKLNIKKNNLSIINCFLKIFC